MRRGSVDPVAEVEAAMGALVDAKARRDAAQRAHYHGSRHPHLGLTLPVQRRRLEAGYSFSGAPLPARLKIWTRIWREAPHFEAKSQAVLFAETIRTSADFVRAWPTLRDWVGGVDSWPHSDGLSAFYARALEAHPGRVYPTLVTWNRARNPWKRRQSIVSLIYYARARASVLPAGRLLPLVEALLGDPDAYVQKGLGWTLREIGNVYPQAHRSFLDSHITRLSSIAFSAATEKLTRAQKAPYKARRASMRRRSVAS